MIVGDQTRLASRATVRLSAEVSGATISRGPGGRVDHAYLIALSVIAGSSVLAYGGASPPHLDICLVALGVLAIAFWGTRAKPARAPALPLKWALPLAALPLLVALQLIPLPLDLLSIVSPARSRLAIAASPALGASNFAPLSVAPGATLAHGVRLLAYLSVFLLVRELAWSLRSRRWLLAAPLVAIAAMQSCLAIFQWRAGAGQVQATGSYVNPNHFAGLLELALPMAMALAIVASHPRPGVVNRSAGDCALAIAVGTILLIVTGLVLSLSRMGFVSGIVAVFATLALTFHRRGASLGNSFVAKAAAVLIALALFGTFLIQSPEKLISRFGYLAEGDGIAAHSRLPLWHDTFQLIREYPVFGSGLGAFESPFLKHKQSEPMLLDQYAHNDYLQVLAETGLLGLSILLWILITALRSCLAPSGAGTDRALAAGAFGAFAAIAIHSLTDFNLYIPANAIFVARIGGIAASIEDTSVQGVKTHATSAWFRRTLNRPFRWASRR